VQRISPSTLLLLKAALLEGDAAISAYRTWRPTFNLKASSPSQVSLIPLLQSNLMRLGVNDPLLGIFGRLRQHCWLRNQKVLTFAKRAFEKLDQNDLPFIVLKGAALIACNLAHRSIRPMSDVDILVPENRLRNAIGILAELHLHPLNLDRVAGISVRDLALNHHDCRRKMPGWNFVGPDGGIDLHWKALHLDRRPTSDDQFWQTHRKACLDGMPIRVLDPAHQLIHICAHAAQQSAGVAAERWPADAILVIQDGKDLSMDLLIKEAYQRRLSAITAECLRFLVDEFTVSIPKSVITRLHNSATWTERLEIRRPPTFPEESRTTKLVAAVLTTKRSGVPLSKFLKNRTGTASIIPALIVSLQIVVGRPNWLRRILGRDRYRVLPTRLPRVGDTLSPGDPDFDRTALIAGWRAPEANGVRTSSHEATVAYCIQVVIKT
jgi:hypothetical protein